ncbi:Hypothetical predicted protein [Marmota monax]|uniref:Uncharacterized protein n=1 Tax=Marmota monax TaxID=9995 RepID=A0A5E4B3I6_MARMO|nr:Hypothetical predicted protein [Marmota monax]
MAAGETSAQTLHLSRRRAAGRTGCAAPGAQLPPGPAAHPGQRRHRERPGNASSSRKRRRWRRWRRPQSWASSPCSRGGGGSARGGARSPAPGEGSAGRALTRSRRSPARRREGAGRDHGETPPPRPAPDCTTPAGGRTVAVS